MNFASLLAFSSGLLAGALAFGVFFQSRRAIQHWLFAAGMATLALESLCAGFAADAVLPEEVAYWQDWRLLAMAILPGTWLAFSLCYARGDGRKFLLSWWPSLALAFLAPLALAILFHGRLVAAVGAYNRKLPGN